MKRFFINFVLVVLLLLTAMGAGWQDDPNHPCYRKAIVWEALPQEYWTTRHGDLVRLLDSGVGMSFLRCSVIPYWTTVYDYRDFVHVARLWRPKSLIEQAAEMLKETMNKD